MGSLTYCRPLCIFLHTFVFWILQTQTLGERLLVLVLTQLDYRAREAEGEVPYGCCPPTDPTYLLWAHHTLAGMASIKRKGTQ